MHATILRKFQAMDKGSIILARRYARAYLELFFDTIPVASYKAFERAADLFVKKPRLGFLLDLGVIDRDLKIKEVDRIAQLCGLPTSCEKLVVLVVDHKRGSLLGEIFAQIADLYKHRAKIDDCYVTSSISLSDKEKKEVESGFEQQTGVTLNFEYSVDPSLIAGMRCQTTALLWEDSVDQRLRRLENVLKR